MHPSSTPPGVLYLIPSFLGKEDPSLIPPIVKEKALQIQYFFAEDEKSCRRFLKAVGVKDISVKQVLRLDEHTVQRETEYMLDMLKQGHDAGIISEAGMPAVADPGAELVRLAHEIGVHVCPLPGSSAILLALAASGLNGQNFTFHGYLPVKPNERKKMLRQIEAAAYKERRTQIFIETPYRNNQLLGDILSACRDETLLCIASSITAPEEFVQTRSVKLWRSRVPDLQKKPAVFLVGY